MTDKTTDETYLNHHDLLQVYNRWYFTTEMSISYDRL